MESIGKVIAILPLQQGVSQATGNTWMNQSFVIETPGQYPKRQCFEIFGEERIKANLPQIDADVKVSFDLESREWQGKWFTSARAYKVERNTDAKPMAAQPMSVGHIGEAQEAKAPMPPVAQPTHAVEEDNTNLPF